MGRSYVSICSKPSQFLFVVLTATNSPQALYSHKRLEDNYMSTLHSSVMTWHIADRRYPVITGWEKNNRTATFSTTGVSTTADVYSFLLWDIMSAFPSIFSIFKNVKLNYKVWLLPESAKGMQCYIIKLGLSNMDSVGILLSSCCWKRFLAEGISLISICSNP